LPAGVQVVCLRHDLETLRKRLKALEAKVAEEGALLTEAQVVALEKGQRTKEARRAGHVLRRHVQRRRAGLPADIH
jgi:hypothetical protein